MLFARVSIFLYIFAPHFATKRLTN